jgi:hypothetical protein
MKDGKELVTDLSNHGLRPDGTHDTCDAFELYCKENRFSKEEALRRLGKEKAAQARQILEDAARSGQPLPAWIEEILTDAGRARYAQLAEQAGYGDLVAQICKGGNAANRNEKDVTIEDQDAQSSVISSEPSMAGGVTGLKADRDQDQQAESESEEPEVFVPETYKGRVCPRCGRTGEITRHPETGLLSCVCYREDFETAQAGKLVRGREALPRGRRSL